MSNDTRRRLSPEARRNELLGFGQLFFAEHPVDAFSMAQIAEQAGVSKGLLYNYFGGRRGFYVATVEAIAIEVADVTEPEEGMPFPEALRRALLRYVDWVRSNGDIYRVLVKGGLGVDPEVGAIVEGLRRQSVERVAKRAGHHGYTQDEVDSPDNIAIWEGAIKQSSRPGDIRTTRDDMGPGAESH